METHTPDKKYLTVPQLRARWSCSHMLIERRLRDDPEFPQPIRLGSARRLWDLSEIEAYEKRAAPAAQSTQTSRQSSGAAPDP
jgi:predicted DNA-binding transcriptional regulator AlpA